MAHHFPSHHLFLSLDSPTSLSFTDFGQVVEICLKHKGNKGFPGGRSTRLRGPPAEMIYLLNGSWQSDYQILAPKYIWIFSSSHLLLHSIMKSMSVTVAIAVRNKPPHTHYPAGLPATMDPHFAATGFPFHGFDDGLRRDQ